MKFIDEVRIYARSGKGGDGAIAWLREKYRPFGGPAGGDGGKGGDIVFIADSNVGTLLDYRYTREHAAKDGERGGGKNCHGSDAEDRLIRVPVGTQIYNDSTGELLKDMKANGEHWIGLPGGKGGKGNARFATPTNRAPKHADPGEPAVERQLRLELKLLADVGLVGYPNAGKSTLLSRVSAAKPKIADYPFTTLVPNLGVVRAPERSFVMADIPGLIEGASEGVGLGIRFLRHIERTALFLHVIDLADPMDGGPWSRFQKVENELLKYKEDLGERPALVALNKMDLPDANENLKSIKAKFKKRGLDVFAISGVTGKGIPELVNELASRVTKLRAAAAAAEAKAAAEAAADDESDGEDDSSEDDE